MEKTTEEDDKYLHYFDDNMVEATNTLVYLQNG